MLASVEEDLKVRQKGNISFLIKDVERDRVNECKIWNWDVSSMSVKEAACSKL